jgi:nicotinate phosphoribosyltransferase
MENLTELYQLVAAAVYHADGLWGEATFDLYLRDLPPHFGYAILAGVDEAIDAVINLSLRPTTVAWLRARPEFARVSDFFFESLSHLRFSGDVWSMPEGSPFFPEEPILRVTAPLIQCVLLESSLIQRVGFGSAVATRASRLALAAQDREVLDFSARRWACPEAARAASRAAFVGGISSTSNVQAAGSHAIAPIGALSGTFMAVYREERRALEAMRIQFPDALQVTIDEDPELAVPRFLDGRGVPSSVRLSDPHLEQKAAACRRVLDEHGLQRVRVMASGGLDEVRIAQLMAAKAPIDQLAVGTILVRGVEELHGRFSNRIAEMWRGTRAEPITAPGSAPHPGAKQVIRYPHKDVVCLETETASLARKGGVPMLHHVVTQGERQGAPAPLIVARGLRAAGVEFLPPSAKRLRGPKPHDVEISAGVAALER